MSDVDREDGASDDDKSKDIIEQVRADVRRIITTDGRSAAALAREADIAGATFSAWLNGTYAGRMDVVTGKVQVWLSSRTAAQRTRAAAPRTPGYVATQSSLHIRSLLEYAQHTPAIVVCDGGPGVGKTTTCLEYQRTSPAVWMTTAEPAWSTPRMLLDAVAMCMGVSERYSAQRISHAIVQRLRNSGGLVIIDEAHNLSSPAIDQLRTFHDLGGVGIALVGNSTVYSRLEGEGRKPQFAMLFSRIGRRLSRPKPYKDDVEAMLDAWSITTAPERSKLHQVAKLPGALREMSMMIRQAYICAKSADRDAITVEDIKAAGQLRGVAKTVEGEA